MFIYELEGTDGLFLANINLAVRQMTLSVGDTVTVTYIESDEDGVYTVSAIEW